MKKSRPTPDCVRRLQKELVSLKKNPIDNILALPHPSNILEWYYVFYNIDDDRFRNGTYFGRVVFPPTYPLKPPAIYMSTPNGRFEIEKQICLSMSNFHPESWNPMWSTSSILTGLLSYMLDKDSVGSVGTVSTSLNTKKELAQKSMDFNMKNVHFRTLFPELISAHQQRLKEEREAQAAQAAQVARAVQANTSAATQPALLERQMEPQPTTTTDSDEDDSIIRADFKPKKFAVEIVIVISLAWLSMKWLFDDTKVWSISYKEL